MTGREIISEIVAQNYLCAEEHETMTAEVLGLPILLQSYTDDIGLYRYIDIINNNDGGSLGRIRFPTDPYDRYRNFHGQEFIIDWFDYTGDNLEYLY